jgi:hypothetical protein
MKTWSNPRELRLTTYYIPMGARWNPLYEGMGRWRVFYTSNDADLVKQRKHATERVADHHTGVQALEPADECYLKEDYFNVDNRAKMHLVLVVPEELYYLVAKPETNEYGEISP